MYCIKEKKKKTKDIDPTYVRSKNNRLMLKAKYGSCGIIKTQFVKEKKEDNLISIKQCFLYYQKGINTSRT